MKIKIILSTIAFTVILGVFGQNISVNDSLELVLKTAKEDTVKVNNLYSLSKQYRNISNFEKAMQYAESALVLADKINYKRGKANAYNIIGNLYIYTSNYPEALKNSLAALKISEELRYKKGIVSSYNNIGIIYDTQGKYAEALENFSACLKIEEEIGNKKNIATSYNNIGYIYRNQGNYAEALEKYFASLKICEEIGDKVGIARSYNNIGIIYRIQGNYAEALETYLASLNIREEIGDKFGIASLYLNIGIVYGSQGKYAEALENSLASLKICEEIGDLQGVGYSYSNIGQVYEILGNYPEALKNYLASLKIYEEIVDKEGIANSYNSLGSLNIHLGNFQDARKYLDDGLALSVKIGNKSDIQSSYGSLSRLDSVEGNFVQALEHYKMYTFYKDSLLNEESNNQIARMKIQYETEKKDREIELLNKDNEIKSLQLAQQQVSLLAARLEAEKNQSELLLMNNSMEIQELKMAETQKDLERKQAEAEVKAAEMELLNKDKKLQEKQLENQRLVRNGIIAGTALLLLVGLLLFRSFRLRKKFEKQQAIVQERKRISADLHDDVGSGLSRIMLLSELVKKEARTPETRKEAEKISTISQELSSNISEIIWALNSNNDYIENLAAYIRRYAAEYFETSSVRLNINTPAKMDHVPISGERRRNIFYAVKEALHNIIKHAQASEAELKFTVEHDILSVVIKDNGKGIPKGELNRFGNGMSNMQNRMKSIKGNFSIENHLGTKITLTVPV